MAVRSKAGTLLTRCRNSAEKCLKYKIRRAQTGPELRELARDLMNLGLDLGNRPRSGVV